MTSAMPVLVQLEHAGVAVHSNLPASANDAIPTWSYQIIAKREVLVHVHRIDIDHREKLIGPYHTVERLLENTGETPQQLVDRIGNAYFKAHTDLNELSEIGIKSGPKVLAAEKQKGYWRNQARIFMKEAGKLGHVVNLPPVFEL